jgi:hypothetical protein
MAYLDNSEITVDAILTTKGRQKLAQGQNLGITKFALGDDEIDYTLYEPAHPLGSAYYDSIIRAIPITEANPHEQYALRYKLVTLPAGTTRIPIVSLGYTSMVVNQKAGATQISPSTNPSGNNTYGYTAVLANNTAGTLVVSRAATATFDSSIYTGTVSKTATVVSGMAFSFTPNKNLTQDLTTTLTIYGNETGASITIPVSIKYVPDTPVQQ